MASLLEHKLSKLGLTGLYPLFRREKIDDSLLAGLTDSDLREIGVAKLGDRKRLLAEFSGGAIPAEAGLPDVPSGAEPASSPPPQPAKSQPKPDPQDQGAYADLPHTASLQRPFLNSLDLPFVPIPRSKTLFCIWQVRIRDYSVYCSETQAPMPAADFPQDPDHPVVNVTWSDANQFCNWLTSRDLWLGLLNSKHHYRLPKDEEWSAASGLPFEHGISPRARSGVILRYPWGPDYPPPLRAGNYHPRLGVDEFKDTSPVGSFPPNQLGIYDLGGNVWEWCMDEFEKGSSFRVLRGASCFNDDPELLLASHRDKLQPEKSRNNTGFRIAIGIQSDRDPWSKA